MVKHFAGLILCVGLLEAIPAMGKYLVKLVNGLVNSKPLSVLL